MYSCHHTMLQLAKRMIKKFPKLINDIYISEEWVKVISNCATFVLQVLWRECSPHGNDQRRPSNGEISSWCWSQLSGLSRKIIGVFDFLVYKSCCHHNLIPLWQKCIIYIVDWYVKWKWCPSLILIVNALISFRSPALAISSVQLINNPAGFENKNFKFFQVLIFFFGTQDWHPDSGEGSDQDDHQLCGKVLSTLSRHADIIDVFITSDKSMSKQRKA